MFISVNKGGSRTPSVHTLYECKVYSVIELNFEDEHESAKQVNIDEHCLVFPIRPMGSKDDEKYEEVHIFVMNNLGRTIDSHHFNSTIKPKIDVG